MFTQQSVFAGHNKRTSISIMACQQQFVVGAQTTEEAQTVWVGGNISSSQTSFINKILHFKLGGAGWGRGGPMRQQRGSQVTEAGQQEGGQ